MPVTDISADADTLTVNITADFAAPRERVWKVFTDPRQLERFWGPPGWPATFTGFDFAPGGLAQYHMTSPNGEVSRGRWEFLSIDEPRSFEVLDGFADEDGDLTGKFEPMRMVFAFEETPTGTRLNGKTYFTSADSLEQMVQMGMVEGTRLAMGQLDTVLQDLRDYAAGKGTQLEVLDDRHVRITRVIDGPRDLVWRAHHEPDLIRQWMLGPDGWRMTDCEISDRHYRNAWAPESGTEGEPFGFEGDILYSEPQRRTVMTERMAGTDGPETMNDLQLYEEDGATLLTMLIEYPDAATRDAILATGMIDGMEDSYARLERALIVS